MEGILRQPDLAEIEHLFATSFNMDGQVVYFPVRHHSPACALHLQRTIDSFRPELILIEGPSDSTKNRFRLFASITVTMTRREK